MGYSKCPFCNSIMALVKNRKLSFDKSDSSEGFYTEHYECFRCKFHSYSGITWDIGYQRIKHTDGKWYFFNYHWILATNYQMSGIEYSKLSSKLTEEEKSYIKSGFDGLKEKFVFR